MRLIPEIEKAWEDFKRNAEEEAANEPANENPATYTERESDSADWDVGKRLVRLDHAIMALHIMAARHSFVGLAKVWSLIAERIGIFFAGIVTGAKARKALGRTPGRITLAQVLSLIAQTVLDSFMHAKLERSIRDASYSTRIDLFRLPMKANPKRPRKTKLVFTRHPIPKQRKTNSGWRSPR